MLSAKQLSFLNKSSKFNNLALEQPEIYYLIRKYKIEPFLSKVKKIRIARKLWTKEIITKCSKICINRSEFNTYFESASTIARRDGYFEELMKDKPFWKDNFTKYDLNSVLKLAESNDIVNYSDFRTKHPSPYQQSHHQGWLNIIKKFIEQKQQSENLQVEKFLIKNKNIVKNIKPKKTHKKIKIRDSKYSDEYLIGMAKQFECAKEFSNAHPLLYKTLLRRGLTNNVFENPIYQRYSDEDLINIALKYYSKAEFVQKESGAFWAVKNRGLMNKACAHMRKLEDSLGEILVRKAFNYYFNKIFYKIRPVWLKNPKTQKLLELDGYNEELNIAFEVNGGYHFYNRRNKRTERLETTKYKDRYKKKTCKKKGVRLYVFNYKNGNIDNLCQQLYQAFGIPLDVLMKLKLETLPSLNELEINILKRKYKIGSKFNVKNRSLKDNCLLLNNLRKENLSNHKVCQIIGITIHQLQKIINKINKDGLALIQR